MTETTQTEAKIVEAGEYVLGVMTDAERQDFERRLNQDPDLAREVSSWTEHFAAMSRKFDQEPVSPKVWARVDRSIATVGERAASPAAPPLCLVVERLGCCCQCCGGGVGRAVIERQ